ncbi:hypothetical protein MIR68_000323, partial [Amoeboaphelidium protococcarum]
PNPALTLPQPCPALTLPCPNPAQPCPACPALPCPALLYIQDGRIVRQVLNDFKIDIGGIDPEQFQQWVRNRDKIGNDME